MIDYLPTGGSASRVVSASCPGRRRRFERRLLRLGRRLVLVEPRLRRLHRLVRVEEVLAERRDAGAEREEGVARVVALGAAQEGGVHLLREDDARVLHLQVVVLGERRDALLRARPPVHVVLEPRAVARLPLELGLEGRLE